MISGTLHNLQCLELLGWVDVGERVLMMNAAVVNNRRLLW
jgi:hypothetical protein